MRCELRFESMLRQDAFEKRFEITSPQEKYRGVAGAPAHCGSITGD
jgi:hypothetical protein